MKGERDMILYCPNCNKYTEAEELSTINKKDNFSICRMCGEKIRAQESMDDAYLEYDEFEEDKKREKIKKRKKKDF